MIRTSEIHNVQKFVDFTFEYAELDVEKHVRIDQKYFHPTEVKAFQADSQKSEQKFGWNVRIILVI